MCAPAVLPVLALAALLAPASPPAPNPTPPPQPVKLVFVHHSTGENWLTDGNGDLGAALAGNWFVSDTNYGWGPADVESGYGTIGDRTDIGDFYDWFSGPNRAAYTAALYAESATHSGYARTLADPGGENEVVLFKSCFPNSALGGSPSDPVPPIESNPLRGQTASSPDHTVANAKGIYRELLNYFGTRTDKLFVLVTAPPLTPDSTDATQSANARALNDWLVNDWLAAYPYRNVAVFDFYNVLTSNGGSTAVNDLGWAGGNHHRFRGGAVEHVKGLASDTSAYGTDPYDSHPTPAGSLKATGEFPLLLNVAYHCWKGTGGCQRPGLSFYTVPPCRVLDTRDPDGPYGGPALAPGGVPRTFVLAGACGIPAGAVSVLANVTVTGAAADGFLALSPARGTWSGASTLNFRAGRTRANNAVLVLASDGSGGVEARAGGPGSVHLIVDVAGYAR